LTLEIALVNLSANVNVFGHRIVVLMAATMAAGIVASAAPGRASATWCWPSAYPTCSTSSYGLLGGGTSNNNNCWYISGEVCSGYNYYINNAVVKLCYPGSPDYGCPFGDTLSKMLYGYENADRIRGRYTIYEGTWNIQPADVGMGGYLRAQVSWDYGCCGNANKIRVSALT
jgi:hypothetical protein